MIRFSLVHRLTGAGWVTAMVLMALVEVVSRTLILVARSWALRGAGPVVATAG